jgi:hypothetical protein
MIYAVALARVGAWAFMASALESDMGSRGDYLPLRVQGSAPKSVPRRARYGRAAARHAPCCLENDAEKI